MRDETQDALRGWMSLPCLYAKREGQEEEKGEKGGGAGEGLRDETPYIVVGYLNFITFSTYF